MRTLNRIIAAFLIGTIGIFSTGCFGGFELIKKVYNWNDGLSDSKFVKTLVFYLLNIIPVYGVAGMLDFVIFNLIEFWGGSNPLAMSEGDMEEQYFAHHGVDYRMVVTKNQYAVTALNGPKAGTTEVVRFNPEDATWYAENGTNSVAIVAFDGQNQNLVYFNTREGTAQYVISPAFDGNDLAAAIQPLSPDMAFASAK